MMCRFDSCYPYKMKWIAPTDYDKTVLLIIFALTVFVGGGALVLAVAEIISDERAFQIDLMAFGWLIGALMSYGYERVKRHKRFRLAHEAD